MLSSNWCDLVCHRETNQYWPSVKTMLIRTYSERLLRKSIAYNACNRMYLLHALQCLYLDWDHGLSAPWQGSSVLIYVAMQTEITFQPKLPWPGSVVVERSPGMREVGGSIPGRIKQKTLKFEVLLLCLALSTKELETVWPARSQNNGLGWDITAYPWRGVSVG